MLLELNHRNRRMVSKGANVYSRLYILNGNFRMFSEISYGYSLLKYFSNSGFSSGEVMLERFKGSVGEKFTFGIGANIFLSKRLSFEMKLQQFYLRNISVKEGTIVYHTITPSFGLQFFTNKRYG